ncbi:hypothetical protein [Longimicrobium sp.]|jgi:hypothetical protein|uniref:hypothetical protein n=1 Tax=Longimicrobium sp. TaxID=2029185 RepID=UPI002F9584B6
MSAPDWQKVATILAVQVRHSSVRDDVMGRLRTLEVRFPAEALEYQTARSLIAPAMPRLGGEG